jgi:hypothetical protein
MTEENVLALKWLIASLELRLIDLRAGKLDESLEDLALFPIPVQYRSLCLELKCSIPTIPDISVNYGDTPSPALLKGDLGNDTSDELVPSVLTSATAKTDVGKLSPMNLSESAIDLQCPEVLVIGLSSPATGNQRKLLTGEKLAISDSKKLSVTTRGAEIDLTANLSSEKQREVNAPAATVETLTAQKVGLTSDIAIKTDATPPILSPSRTSTRSFRGAVLPIEEDISATSTLVTPVVKTTASNITTVTAKSSSKGNNRTLCNLLNSMVV